MTLTESQIVALQQGDSITVFSEEAGVVCVVIPADRYLPLPNSGGPPSEDWPRVAYPAVLKAWDAAGSPDDGELYRE